MTPTQTHNPTLDAVADTIAASTRLLFITGAGLSADAGIPTYRGVGGIYDDGQADQGLPMEVILSGETFQRDPGLTWRHLARVEAAARGAAPSEGHRVIAALQARRQSEVHLITQNVDGLHQAAGSEDVIEIHGNARTLRCTECGQRTCVPDYSELTIPPSCAVCHGLLRPDVVLFGEMLPEDAVARLTAETARGFDAVVSVGTSSLFPYVTEPLVRAGQRGAVTVEINPETTSLSQRVDYRIADMAGNALTAVWHRISARDQSRSM